MDWGDIGSGFVSRIGDIASSTGEALEAPFGWVGDMASSALHPSEWAGTLWTRTLARGAQVMEGLMGPESAMGTAFDMIPEGLGVREAGHGINVGLQDAYTYGISRPITSLMTVASLANSPTYNNGQDPGFWGNWGAFVDPDAWSYAWDQSNARSPGQAIALAMQTKDILDPNEVAHAMDGQFYKTASGVADGLLRWELDPAKLAAEGVEAGRFLQQPGTVAATAAPELASRFLRYRMADPGRIDAINSAMRTAFYNLPERLQNVIGKDAFAPEDMPRLIQNEITKLQVGASKLTDDPAAAQAMLDRANEIQASVRDTPQIVELRKNADLLEGTNPEYAANLRARASDLEAQTTTADIVNRARDRLQTDITTSLTPPETRTWLANHLFGSAKWQGVTDQLNSLEQKIPGQDADSVAQRAGAIRDGLFPTHGNGDTISWALAKAQGPAEREQVLRLFMGDMGALQSIRAQNVALGNRLEDLLHEQATIRANPDWDLVRPKDPANPDQLNFGSILNSPLAVDVKNRTDRLQSIDDELAQTIGQQGDINRIRGQFASLSTRDINPVMSRVRNFVIQDGPLSRAVRFFGPESGFNHVLDFADESADGHFARILRRAGMDSSTIGQWRGQFASAEFNQRPQIFDNAMDAATRKVLEDHGLEPNEIDAVLAHANEGRRGARDIIANQTPKFDGEGRAIIRFNDENGETIELPLMTTQLQNVGFAPNFTELNKAAEDYAVFKYGEDWRKAIQQAAKPLVNAAEFGHAALTGITNIWRPTILLRPAWTARVVLMDEQLRQIAQFGALATMLSKREELSSMFTSMREKHPWLQKVLGKDNVTSATTRGAVSGAIAGTALAGPPGAVIGAAVTGGFLRNLAGVEEAGYRNLTLNGYRMAGPFGDVGSKAEVYRQLASIGAGVPEYFDAYSNKLLSGLRRDGGNWTTYQWGRNAEEDAKYRASWAHDVRQQIAQDPMGRQFLQGKTVEQVHDWLTGTMDGRRYMAQIPGRMRDTQGWVNAVADQVDAYTGGLDEVKQGILALGDKSPTSAYDSLLNQIPPEQRAPIHGAALQQTLGGKSVVKSAVTDFVDHAFDVLGTIPHDELVANPTYSRYYTAEIKRRLGNVPTNVMNHDELLSIEDSARRAALRQFRMYAHDLGEKSRFEELTRNLIPFMGATRQIVSRWAGLVADNPVFGVHAAQLWSGIDKTGWVTTDADGNEYINIRLPTFAKALIDQGMFKSALDDQGNVRLGKDGFSIIGSGGPGFGPFAQIAVSEMAKQKPSLEESLKFVIPNGPVDPIEAFTPPTFQRITASMGGEDDRSYAFARNRILITKLTDMQLGKAPMIDFSDPNAVSQLIGQTNDEAKQFMRLRTVASAFSPAAPVFDSPYQPYIDIYRQLRDGKFQDAMAAVQQMNPEAAAKLQAAEQQVVSKGEDPATNADHLFLDAFGPEYFYLTQAFTKSNDGVPPTTEGVKIAAGLKDLIEKHPDWGSVIVGSTGGGQAVQFSRAAYDAQLGNPLRTGSDQTERSILAPEDIVNNAQVRLGWEKYSKVSDAIENLRIQMGLPSLQGNKAAGLRQLKQALVLSLAQESPTWFKDYSTRDDSKWQQDVAAMTDIANDPRLQGRDDIRGMKTYLGFRNQILAMLDARKSHSITAQANQDLAALWHVGVTALVSSNTAFADLYYRRLEHDPMTVDTLNGGVFGQNLELLPGQGQGMVA